MTDPVDPFSAHQTDGDRPATPPERTAVLVIDVLNDFVESEGAMYLPGGEELMQPVNALTAAARTAGAEVVFLNARYQEGDRLFDKRTPHCLAGTTGAELPEEIVVKDPDHIIHKRRYSGFFATDLDLWLREHDIKRVVLCGLVTNICVRSTAHDAFFLGYEVAVAEDACRATGPREHASSLYDIKTHFGTVQSVEQIVAAWDDN